MACLKLKTMRIILMSVIFLSSVRTGCGLCRPVCTETGCVTVHQDRVDFKTAVKACRDRHGELLTLNPETHASLLDNLRQQLSGNFWIGLRLPADTCSNISSPLRGYEWLSRSSNGSFIPSSETWKHSVKVCSPSCVSLSNDQKWTERLCSNRTDGYLCRTEHYDACLAEEVHVPHVFLSSTSCLTGPCQHECTDLRGGYTCSCFTGYIRDSKDPRKCICDKPRCPRMCPGHDVYDCYCPYGYKNVYRDDLNYEDFFCEDIDECEIVGYCHHNCKNTFGGYECSCKEGFVLEDSFKCIQSDSESFPVTTQITVGFVKPTIKNNHTRKTWSTPAGGFLWLWVCAVVAVVLSICAVRMYVVRRRKQREPNSRQ